MTDALPSTQLSLMPEADHPTASTDPSREFPTGPPAITRRGILIGLGVFLFACTFTGLSIYARRTRLEKTREFFGDDFVTALQLADQMMLLPGEGQSFAPVKLTGTPGLGHLRRALLDERHYQWDTTVQGSVQDVGGDEPVRFTIKLADPTGKRVPSVVIPMELTEGWVATPDGSNRVQVTARVQKALKHQLEMLQGVSQKSYDARP